MTLAYPARRFDDGGALELSGGDFGAEGLLDDAGGGEVDAAFNWDRDDKSSGRYLIGDSPTDSMAASTASSS
jgi:hypothetical protein